MPSRFPGMDPYIESSGLWPDFHQRVITTCSDALNACLPDHYAARIEEQVRLVLPDEDPPATKKIVPDVSIDRGDRVSKAPVSAGGTATLEPATMTIAIELPHEVRETWIEIIRLPERSLVTVIEFVSPTNKEGSGRGEYLDKRRRIFESSAHLVEVDLLVRGRRPPMSTRKPWPAGEYYALISKAEERPDCKVYGWSIRRSIPLIPVPLVAPDPDVWLDLKPIVANAYDRGRYARDIRYDRPLDLPLSPEDHAWAEHLVAAEKPA